jgi:glycosyltransferase involved in cell wall biosynthesis/SAM-dependent methyltransferase
VINSLGTGGAEAVLYRLTTHPSSTTHEVICLDERDWYSDKLEAHGIKVHHLNWKSQGGAAAVVRLQRLIRESDADVVQAWMYRANLVAGLSARLAGKPVLWNIRCSTFDIYPFPTRAIAYAGGVLAGVVPHLIINCSSNSAKLHDRIGYSLAKTAVVPNGFDPASLAPDGRAREKTRNALGIEPGTFVLGSIGRWHVQKGLPLLLRALRMLHDRGLVLKLVLAGRDLDMDNRDLARLVSETGCADQVMAIGERGDIPEIARAIDLHVLASIGGEGFPNVVAETMLSGTPNVATDVGDCSLIIADTGWVIPPRNPSQLADAIQQAHVEWTQSPEKWQSRREAARSRIVDNFSIEAMVRAYETAWRDIAEVQTRRKAVGSGSFAPAVSGGQNAVGVLRGDGNGQLDEQQVAFGTLNAAAVPGPRRAIARNLHPRTIHGFGQEWRHFDQSGLVGREYDQAFEVYFGIFPFEHLPSDAEGFDLGCGSGRWAAAVAPRVGTLHCIDPAPEALEVARRRLSDAPNVLLHLAASDTIPLPDESQDFGYSLGVLHHIPDTKRAVADAVRKLKPGAPFLLYIYYDLENRPAWFRPVWRFSDRLRTIISRLPFGLRNSITSTIAATVYWPLARGSKLVERCGIDPSNIPLSVYRDHSFYTMRTDALDRFGTRLEQRFSRADIETLMETAGLTEIRFREAPPYWVACGCKRP